MLFFKLKIYSSAADYDLSKTFNKKVCSYSLNLGNCRAPSDWLVFRTVFGDRHPVWRDCMPHKVNKASLDSGLVLRLAGSPALVSGWPYARGYPYRRRGCRPGRLNSVLEINQLALFASGEVRLRGVPGMFLL